MAIPKGYAKNLNTLIRAAKDGNLAILDCQDKKTGKMVVAVVAMQKEKGGDVTFVPIAKMFDGNPYEELNPPNPDGGYVST